MSAQRTEFFSAAFHLALEAVLLPLEEVHRWRFFGEAAVGADQADAVVGVLVLLVELFAHEIHLVFVEQAFHAPEPLQAPAGDREFFDEHVLGGVDRGVLGEESFVEDDEVSAIFYGENYGIGQAV